MIYMCAFWKTNSLTENSTREAIFREILNRERLSLSEDIPIYEIEYRFMANFPFAKPEKHYSILEDDTGNYSIKIYFKEKAFYCIGIGNCREIFKKLETIMSELNCHVNFATFSSLDKSFKILSHCEIFYQAINNIPEYELNLFYKDSSRRHSRLFYLSTGFIFIILFVVLVILVKYLWNIDTFIIF